MVAANIKMGRSPPIWAERGNVLRTKVWGPLSHLVGALRRKDYFAFFTVLSLKDCRLLPLSETCRFPKIKEHRRPGPLFFKSNWPYNYERRPREQNPPFLVGRFLPFWCLGRWEFPKSQPHPTTPHLIPHHQSLRSHRHQHVRPNKLTMPTRTPISPPNIQL